MLSSVRQPPGRVKDVLGRLQRRPGTFWDVLGRIPANRLYERGLVVNPLCFGGTERGCERCRPTAWMPAEPPAGRARLLWPAGRSVTVWSSAHVSIASSDFEDQVLSGLAPVAHVNNGLSCSQANNGACRSEGLEWLVAAQHVPDGLGELAGEFDLGDLGAALTPQPALGALVALLEEWV
jgi:hypothetical protein